MPDQPVRRPTRALDRGLRLLALLAAAPDGLAFGVLRQRLDLADSSLARLLHGLSASGHVLAGGDGRWRTGPVWRGLIGPRSWAERLTETGRPILLHLAESTRCTGLLIAWTGGHMVVLDRVLHEDALPLQAPGRVSDNLRHSPWGWLFVPQERLVTLPAEGGPRDDEIAAALAALPKRGWTCRRQSDRVRFAAPLRDHQGGVRGALAIGGTPGILPSSATARIGAQIVAAATSIEALLRP